MGKAWQAAEDLLVLRSRHRKNYAQVSSGCFDFQDHNHQLKNNFMKNLSKLFYNIYLPEKDCRDGFHSVLKVHNIWYTSIFPWLPFQS